MSNGPHAHDDTLYFEEFRLDRSEGLCRRHDSGRWGPVVVGSRAVDILRVLAERRGQLATKQALMDAVWPEIAVEDANLTVQVSALRRILDEGRADGSCIQTVIGRGYRFVPEVTTGEADCSLTNSAMAVDAPVPGSGRRLDSENPKQSFVQSIPGRGYGFRPTVTFRDDREPPDQKIASRVDAESVMTAPTVPPDKPSIAVLPFENMSGDPEQQYFADGMVEEIITALSRVPSFFVIARNSSFSYKGRSPDIRQVGRELGVRYVLEGSVRNSGTRVRIGGQLIDAATGAHIWADRFEGGLEDIFRLQDQVTSSVVGAIEPKIRMAEIERAQRKMTESPRAYDLVLRARGKYELYQKEHLEEGARLLRLAIADDPKCALAFALLARTLWMMAAQHWTTPRASEFAEYVRLARVAVRIGQTDAEALCAAAHIIGLPGGELSEGVAIIDRSLAQNPNSVDALSISGMLRAYLGDTETAMAHLRLAARLSPLGVRVNFQCFGFALACFMDGDYEGTVNWTAQGLREIPNSAPTIRYRAAALGLLGRLDEAREAVNQLRAINPELTIARVRTHVSVEMKSPFRRTGAEEAYYEGLRRAGLPN